ncbi:hypothetical protein [Devosia sp.]|uniref:hypothetical protein n=1 Tax=Devosia sp. TaxID=1871048 RepID=UPI003BAA1197
MKTQLANYQKKILRKCLGASSAEWIGKIADGSISDSDAEFLIDKLSEEFHLQGIDKNWEATRYGKEVWSVVDLVNGPRLAK